MGAVCDRCGAKKIVHICDLCGVIEFQRECARLAARNANLLAALRDISRRTRRDDPLGAIADAAIAKATDA